MIMKKTFASFSIFGLALVMMFSGILLGITSTPTSASAATPKSGGTLKLMVTHLPDAYGNVKSTFPVGFTGYLFPAVETLVGLSKEGPVPTKLAASWEISRDGKGITFNLRKGVKFHDGADFNAEAVKWNLEQLLKIKPELKIITSISVMDKYKVKLNLAEYDNALLYHLSWLDGLMVSPASVQGRDAAYISTHLVGTGPFEFVSFSKDTSAVFKKFKGYWDKGKPSLDGIEYIAVRDDNTARNAFLSGQAQAWDYVLPRHSQEMRSLGYKVNNVPGTMMVAFGDSANADSPFAKLQVRQALDYAIDKQAIADTFGAGTWEAPMQPCSSRLLGYIPNFQGRTYNPAKAKQLLAEAGYPQGFKTIIYYKAVYDDQVMVAVQANLKAIGIDAELQKLDSAKIVIMSTQGWKNGIFVSGIGMTGTYASTLQNDGPSPTKTASAKVTPEYKALLAQASAAKDKATEKKLNQKLVQLAFDEAVIVPIAIQSRNAVYTNSVQFDLDSISLQFWNPGDAVMLK
jgi:peptide/nickel transport system substrate-binding protein